jgi:hypothetical protein
MTRWRTQNHREVDTAQYAGLSVTICTATELAGARNADKANVTPSKV